MAYVKEDIQEYFQKCKTQIEADFQRELDKLAGENEPEKILAAYDNPDEYRDNEEDR